MRFSRVWSSLLIC